MPEATARSEARRGTFDPTYGIYTWGKWLILDAREDARKVWGDDFSLRRFHDALLELGSPPLGLVGEAVRSGGVRSAASVVGAGNAAQRRPSVKPVRSPSLYVLYSRSSIVGYMISLVVPTWPSPMAWPISCCSSAPRVTPEPKPART